MLVRLLPILGITFVDILGFSIIIPILPYFVKHFGSSDLVVGILFSTFAACQFIAGPVWGYASDRIGRKWILVISQVGASIGWLMLAFAHNMATVFAARIVEGASGGNISVTQAYVADLVEPQQRARAFAYVGAAFSAGIVFGPFLGGILLERYGFSAPFLAATALQVITLILTLALLPESTSREAREKVATPADIVRSLRDPQVAPVLWNQWAYSLGLYAWFGVFALFLQATLAFSPSETSFFFAAFGALSVILQVGIVGPINERLGDRLTCNLGLACTVLAFCTLPFVRSLPSVIPMFVLFGTGMALARPSFASLLTRATPENQRGTILGVGSSLDSLSGVAMPPVSTGLLERFGAPWAGAASLTFASIALLMGLIAQTKEQRVSQDVAAERSSAK